MPLRSRFLSLFRTLFRRADLEHDLDEEIRSYLDMLEEEKIRAGMSPDAARRESLLEFGGAEQVN